MRTTCCRRPFSSWSPRRGASGIPRPGSWRRSPTAASSTGASTAPKLWDLVDTAILELLADVEAPPQERADLRYDLDSLLSDLPDRCRSLLRLRYGFGCSTAETAERMGYCKSSIRKVTRRCLAALTEQLLGRRLPARALTPRTPQLALTAPRGASGADPLSSFPRVL